MNNGQTTNGVRVLITSEIKINNGDISCASLVLMPWLRFPCDVVAEVFVMRNNKFMHVSMRNVIVKKEGIEENYILHFKYGSICRHRKTLLRMNFLKMQCKIQYFYSLPASKNRFK